jgi:hypothetical protein
MPLLKYALRFQARRPPSGRPRCVSFPRAPERGRPGHPQPRRSRACRSPSRRGLGPTSPAPPRTRRSDISRGILQTMAWRKPQACRNRGRGHPEVDVRPASTVLVEVGPDHPFVENVGACNRHRGSQSKSGLDEKNHEPSCKNSVTDVLRVDPDANSAVVVFHTDEFHVAIGRKRTQCCDHI